MAVTKKEFDESFKASIPIILGYLVLGIPCGILCASAGIDMWMVIAMSVLFYSGTGQYMIPNMYLAANPLAAIIASVALVNARQMLYGASLAQFCGKMKKRWVFYFGATVTDETFGVSVANFMNGIWTTNHAVLVNAISHGAWILANVIGALIGSVISFPTALASFAMTSLFICLLCMEKVTASNLVAAGVAIVTVIVCKLVGLSDPAIFLGAIAGIAAAVVFSLKFDKKQSSSISVEG